MNHTKSDEGNGMYLWSVPLVYMADESEQREKAIGDYHNRRLQYSPRNTINILGKFNEEIEGNQMSESHRRYCLVSSGSTRNNSLSRQRECPGRIKKTEGSLGKEQE